jgi:two-component system, NtrC family, sensor kinase
LHQEDYSEYFGAMVQGDTISAADALRHPLTICFAETYFDPLEIKSLLDVSIIVKGKVIGVLCCEHCEHRKEWTTSDIEYLNAVASMLSLATPLQMAMA